MIGVTSGLINRQKNIKGRLQNSFLIISFPYLGVLDTACRRLRTGVGYLGSCQRESWQSKAALISVKFEGGLELVRGLQGGEGLLAQRAGEPVGLLEPLTGSGGGFFLHKNTVRKERLLESLPLSNILDCYGRRLSYVRRSEYFSHKHF